MAIALDANLGTLNQDSSSTTIALTTTNAVAAGATILLGITSFETSGTLTGVSGGGLTWSIDKQGRPASNSQFQAIVSAYAPSGLASSTVITATWNAAQIARNIGGTSFTGIKTSSPVDGTPTGPTLVEGAAGWSTPSYTIQAGSMIFAVCFSENTALGSTPTGPSLEAWEINNAGGPYGSVANYRIESSAGSYTVAGTWGATANHSNVAVAYLAGAVANPTFGLSDQYLDYSYSRSA